jgi:hypothetical protein
LPSLSGWHSHGPRGAGKSYGPGSYPRAVSVSRGAVSVLRGGASRFGVYDMADLLRRLVIAILAGVVVVIYAAGVATGWALF